jgi:hypothetical protein
MIMKSCFCAFLLKLYQLDKVALDPDQPSIEFSITLDGPDLLCNILHVTAQFKLIYPHAINPISGIPIGMKDSRKVQRSELCYPCKTLIAKDSKTLYDKYYSDLFSFFKQVTEHGFGEFTVKENSSGISRFSLHNKFPPGLIVLLEIHGKGWHMQEKD